MLNVPQILVSDRSRDVHRVGTVRHAIPAALLATLLAVALGGCGQRGPLYLPKDAAAKQRATLPDLLTPRLPGSSDAPATPPATPGGTGTPDATETPPTNGTAK
jgi:predicted small lipoprotein YifL